MKHLNTNVKLGKHKKRLFLLGLPVFLLILFFLFAGAFLPIHQSPQSKDAIIILSGGEGRMEEGTILYKKGFAPYVMLSNSKEGISKHGDMLQTALALGIPESSILTENQARSTYQNARFSLPIMKQHGFTSAIVVSSDFHMRRVKFIFDHVYKDSGIKLTYVGADSGYNARYWWSDSYSRETTFNEYIKMIGNAFGYNGPEAKSLLREIKQWLH
ncbi:hypothetical protein BSK62_26050 [Paenibacillus odorifer]|uniref:YdcF family protein n=1 Tax=Paenibacillus TaxID=44249 RepID=UPI00096FE64E|nr:YdcF family protein [Paenibacillus odorifer]OMD60014.1 hypothetical protein BSK62_26050 [Paenibacillus odorifer]